VKVEPVWVSTVDHIARHTALIFEAKRRFREWSDIEGAHPDWGKFRIFLARNFRLPPDDLYGIPKTFPYMNQPALPPVPVIMFTSGQLRIKESTLEFSYKPSGGVTAKVAGMTTIVGKVHRLRPIRFRFPISSIMAVMRYRSPVPLNPEQPIHWIQLVIQEEVLSQPVGIQRWLMRRIKQKVGLTTREQVSAADSIGRKLLLCVGTWSDDFRDHYQHTENLYQAILQLHRNFNPETSPVGE
jgi:hypothetical protein